MNIKCKKDILLNNINIVLKSVSTRTTLPILECILLIADKDGFRLISNDLELGIETSNIDADIMEKGIVALEAKVFADIIRSMPQEFVSIEVDEKNVATITSGQAEFKISGQNGNDFPMITKLEKEQEQKYSFNSLKLKNMIKQTKFSISTDDTKQILMGELLEIKDGFINLVAIDGFRVSFRKALIGTEYPNTEVVIPSKAINEIIKILPDKDDEIVNLYFNKNYILFEISSCIVVSRLLDGEFLKYEQLFPKDYNTEVTINRLSLLSSLERATLISKDNKKTPVKLEIREDDYLIITSRTDLGNLYEEIKVDVKGEYLTIAFNPRYLIDALKAIEDDEIIIQFITSLSPCILRGVGSCDYKYLILPLKLND